MRHCVFMDQSRDWSLVLPLLACVLLFIDGGALKNDLEKLVVLVSVLISLLPTPA